jgi:hypothetical protein
MLRNLKSALYVVKIIRQLFYTSNPPYYISYISYDKQLTWLNDYEKSLKRIISYKKT